MTHLISLFTDNLLPVLLVAGLGFILQRRMHLPARPLSSMVFNVLLPALVFQLLVTTAIGAADILRMMGFALLVMSAVGAVSWGLARALRLSAGPTAALILVTMFMNAGNYGLSVSQLAFGAQGLAWATLFYVASSLLTNSLGIYVASVGRSSPREALTGLLKVPSVYAIPAALVVRLGDLPWPTFISRPVELLASAALPLMLLLLGIQVADAKLPNARGLLALATGLRLLLSPLIALLLAPLFDLRGAAWQAGVLEAGMPTAVLTGLIAFQYDLEPDFIAGTILATTLLSPITLTPLIGLLGG